MTYVEKVADAGPKTLFSLYFHPAAAGLEPLNSMHVSMYAYMYDKNVCFYVSMHVCIYVCMYVSMFLCMYVWFDRSIPHDITPPDKIPHDKIPHCSAK